MQSLPVPCLFCVDGGWPCRAVGQERLCTTTSQQQPPFPVLQCSGGHPAGPRQESITSTRAQEDHNSQKKEEKPTCTISCRRVVLFADCIVCGVLGLRWWTLTFLACVCALGGFLRSFLLASTCPLPRVLVTHLAPSEGLNLVESTTPL